MYILFNGKHGLNEVDRIMLQSLEKKCQEQENTIPWTLQAIITKADQMDGDRAALRAIQDDIFKTAPTCLPPLAVAITKRAQVGVDRIRDSMTEACGLGQAQAKIVHG